jgi:hypothetical protein
MRHAYIVFDNDSPLFICRSKEHADAVILSVQRKLHNLPSVVMDQHYYYHVMVPYAPRSLTPGEPHYASREKPATDA